MDKALKILILSLLLHGLVFPPTFVWAKGPSPSDEAQVPDVARVFVFDLTGGLEPSKCNVAKDLEDAFAQSFPGLADPDPVYFDGYRTYLIQPRPCEEEVDLTPLIALGSFRSGVDQILFERRTPDGEIVEEELQGASAYVAGFQAEMNHMFGDGAFDVFVKELLGYGLAGGVTYAALMLTPAGPVLTGLMAVLIGVGVVSLGWQVGRLIWQKDYYGLGRETVRIFRRIVFVGLGIGGARMAMPAIVGLLGKIPAAQQAITAYQGMVMRWNARIGAERDPLIRSQVDRMLSEIEGGHGPGGGGTVPLKPAPSHPRTTPGDGGVATMTEPRVMTGPSSSTSASALSNAAPLKGASAVSSQVPLAAGTLTIGDPVQATKPLPLGKAWTSQNPFGPSYEDWFQDEVVNLGRETVLGGSVSENAPEIRSMGSRSRKPGPNQLGFFENHPVSPTLLSPRGSDPCGSFSISDYHPLVKAFYERHGKKAADEFQCLIPLFSALQSILLEKELDPILQEQRLRGVWSYLRANGFSDWDALYEKVLLSERANQSTRNEKIHRSRARRKTEGLVAYFAQMDVDLSLDQFLKAMGLEEEVKALRSTMKVSVRPEMEGTTASSSSSIIGEFYEILLKLSSTEQHLLLHSLRPLRPSHLNALVEEENQNQSFSPQLNLPQLREKQREYRRKVFLNLRRLHESMGLYPFFFLTKASANTRSPKGESSPLQRFAESLLLGDLRYGALYDAYFSAIRRSDMARGLSGAKPVPLKKWLGEVFPRGTNFRFLHGKPQTKVILAESSSSQKVGMFSVHPNYQKRTIDVHRELQSLLHQIKRKDLRLDLGNTLRDFLIQKRRPRGARPTHFVFYLDSFSTAQTVSIQTLKDSSDLPSGLSQRAKQELEKIQKETSILEMLETYLCKELGWDWDARVWRPMVP